MNDAGHPTGKSRPRRASLRARAAAIWRGAALAIILGGVALGLWAASHPTPGPAASTGAPAGGTTRIPGVAEPPPGGAALPPGPAPDPAPSRPGLRTTPEPAGRVAIIFDDAGATLAQLDPIIALGRPVTIAVLPGLPASAAVAWAARRAGLEVILHLPIEPEEAERALGPGGITTDMNDEAVAAQVLADLEGVPGAVGLSPHMGSRGTADRRLMAAVLGVVRERGLFFVDSRTTTQTVGATLAREMGIPVAERAVFLDNEDDPAYIAAQVRRLIAVARAQGSAVAIGHVQKQTAEVLRGLLPEFDRARIILVPVSLLVR